MLGATDEILPLCKQYLFSSSVSFIFIALMPVISVFLQLSGKWKIVVYSSFILMILSSGLSIVFVSVFRLPFYFIGIANTISAFVSAMILLLYFLRNNDNTHFSFGNIKISIFGKILLYGFTETASTLLSVIADIVINVIIANVGGTSALATATVIGTVNSFTSVLFSKAFATVTLMIATTFIGENNRKSFVKLIKQGLIISLAIGIFIYSVNYILAPVFSELFSHGNYSYNTYAVKVYYLGALLFPTYIFLTTIMSSQRKTKLVSIISILNNILACLIFYSVPRIISGEKIWYACIVTNIVYLLVILLAVSINNRHIPRSFEDVACIDKDFGVDDENCFEMKVSSIENAISASEKAVEFLNGKNLDEKKSFKCGLCIEELLCNIVEHGFTKDNKKHIIELSVMIIKDKIKIIIRDDCVPFDPHNRFSDFDINNPTKGIGIRMVMKLTEDVSYRSIYKLNVLSIGI